MSTLAENISNPAAEWSVVASMVFESEIIGEVIGTQLAAEDFLRADAKVLYEAVVESFYADHVVEPLSMAERCKGSLARIWDIEDQEVPDELLRRLMGRDFAKG